MARRSRAGWSLIAALVASIPFASGVPWSISVGRSGERLCISGLPAAFAGVASSDPSWQKVIERSGSQIERLPLLGPPGSNAGPRAGAPRGNASAGATVSAGPSGSAWKLQLAAAGTVLRDISFADGSTGYAAGELGVIYRTTDAGANWAKVMDAGYPCYWYGVDALSAGEVVVCGSQAGTGILRWSHDGGATWDAPLAVSPSAPLEHVRFTDPSHGVCTTVAGNEIFYTGNGGRAVSDWRRCVVDPTGGWFTGGFAVLPGGSVFLAGVRFARSPDAGATWTVRPSADALFDGAAEFVDTEVGFTGGGTIAPVVQGWIHRTTDGGERWSGRLTVLPYPVRALKFASRELGWAAGGDVWNGSGGIVATTDGGQSWSQELDAGAELQALALARVGPDSVDVWCCGSTAGFQGRIYKRRAFLPAAGSPADEEAGDAVVRSFPNPFSPATTLSFTISRPESVSVDIFDPAGRMIRSIRPGLLGSGLHRLQWDGYGERGQRLPSGVFFYRLRAGREVHGGTLVLVR